MNSVKQFGQWLLLLACLYSPLTVAEMDDWHFTGVQRIVALGDVHGAYGALVETLQATALVDGEVSWIGRDTHLVFTGDLLDRGPGSRQVMDLVMRLEQEAELAGGQVHLMLGNHEVMNLIGDVRYVAVAEYAAFIEEETAAEREHWYQDFLLGQPTDANEQDVQAEFMKKAPPGFFGHRRAFRYDGYYGQWLLDKPLMVVINETVFVHGGVPPYVAEHGLDGVNTGLKSDLANYAEAQAKLVDAGILNPVSLFREIPPILREKIEAGQIDSALMQSALAAIELTDSPLHSAEGPLWYRGTALCNPLVEADGLNRSLVRIGASRAVFGHTTTVTRQVQQRMDGRILEIDTGMLKSTYKGSGNALVLDDGGLKVVNQDGTHGLSPVAHPLAVGDRTGKSTDDVLAAVLANGTVTDSGAMDAAWEQVQVTHGDHTVTARFSTLPDGQKTAPGDVAAFRLDRMLGLYMVPVTVRREYEGRQGTLQFVPAEVLSEHERVVNEIEGRFHCSLDKQTHSMQVFDALIHNSVRSPESMLYSPKEWMLLLVDHNKAFSTENELPANPESSGMTVGNQWRQALQDIDDETLESALGDTLNKNQLAALAKRRDELIKMSVQP